MFIKLADQKVTLEDAENFRAFKVVSEVGATPPSAMLEGVGRLDGGHVWIDPAWALAQGPDNDTWRDGFANMVGFAKKSGWVDEAGAIRAHIETA